MCPFVGAIGMAPLFLSAVIMVAIAVAISHGLEGHLLRGIVNQGVGRITLTPCVFFWFEMGQAILCVNFTFTYKWEFLLYARWMVSVWRKYYQLRNFGLGEIFSVTRKLRAGFFFVC